MLCTIAEMKARNADKGDFYFSRDTMRFFKSKVHTAPDDYGFFITSEQPPHGGRRYTIRRFIWESGDVQTVGKFCDMVFYDDAKDQRRRLARDCEEPKQVKRYEWEQAPEPTPETTPCKHCGAPVPFGRVVNVCDTCLEKWKDHNGGKY